MNMSRTVIVVAIASVAASGISLAGERVTLPDTSYSVVLPGNPECELQTYESPIGATVPARCTVQVDGLEYSFDYMLLPVHVPSDQAQNAMFGAAMGVSIASGGEMTDKRPGETDGFPSLDFTITGKKGPIGYGRYVMVSNHLVLLVIEGKRKSLSRKAADEVFDSLVVKPDEELR